MSLNMLPIMDADNNYLARLSKQGLLNGLILAPVMALALTLLFAFAAAETGRFSAGGTLAFFFIALVVLCLAGLKFNFFPGLSRPALIDTVLLVALVGFGVLVYFPPSEYVLGGWDPGVYTSTGASIADTGGIMAQEPLLVKLDASELEMFVARRQGGFPELYHGWRIPGAPGGCRLSPQFFHMFPVMQALGHGAGGLSGSLCVSSLVGLGCLVAIFALGRFVSGNRTAIAAALLAACCPAVIWMARFQCSEMPAQLAMLCGFIFLFLACRDADNAPRAGLFSTVLSAVWFGIAQLTRADFIPVAAALAGMGMIAASWPGVPAAMRRNRIVWVCLMLLFLAHTFIYQKTSAPFYLPLPQFTLWGSVAVLAAGAVVAIAVMALGRIADAIVGRVRPFLAGMIAACVVAAFVLAVFFRPGASHAGNSGNILDAARMVSWPVMVVALAGIVAMIVKARRFEDAAFLAACLVVTAAVMAENYVESLYPWAARRLATVAFPFLFLSAAAGVAVAADAVCLLARRMQLRAPDADAVRGLAVAILVVAAAIVYRPDLDAVLVSRDFGGVKTFIGDLGKTMPRADLAIVTDNRGQLRGLAEALRFHEHVPALALKNRKPENVALLWNMLARRLAAHETIYLLSPVKDRLDPMPGINLRSCGVYSWRGEILEQTKRPFPRRVISRGISMVLLRAELAEPRQSTGSMRESRGDIHRKARWQIGDGEARD